MAPIADDLLELSDELNDAASGPGDPSDRIAVVRRLRDEALSLRQPENPDNGEVTALVGQADFYLGRLELRREAEAVDAELATLAASEEQDIHDALDFGTSERTREQG